VAHDQATELPEVRLEGDRLAESELQAAGRLPRVGATPARRPDRQAHREEEVVRIYGMKGVTDIVNLTPHEVAICMWEDNPLVLPSEGVARVEELPSHLHFLAGGLEIKRIVYGAITGLAAPRPGVLHVVSRIVLDAATKDPAHALRRDLVAPGDANRDAAGRVTSVSNLIANGELDLIEGWLVRDAVIRD
jgi:hypothetical protein